MNRPFTKMNYTSLLNKLLILTLVTLATYACNTKTEDEKDSEAVSDSVALASPAQSELNSNQSDLLKTVLGNNTPETIIRGVSFGDPVSKVKATETFEMFEETADHLGYTMETPQLESIDVQYFISKDKKVNKIMVDVYLNSEDATKQLWNAGKSHFSETYAAPKEEAKILTWSKNSVRVNMEDVSKGKDYGLKFEFFPAGSAVLANK
ncbi:hypothetical protein [Dyadobacter sp. CY312]|uniref:hypothetical protein n=1 Tax=Dyadobacter sp. CY312 TaxID=2907303 RepID=UPI001F24002F|nr:hypothetical protein [Dyadobacter sp. CY312]MCE7041904.1 hypothetical protein [Dyadobacter sp. CY312]